MINNLAIIGGGPAGVVAAVYAARAQISTILYNEGEIGGKLWDTLLIGNFPGIDECTGPELQKKLASQMKHNKIKQVKENVIAINYSETKKTYELTTENGNKTSYKFVIIATGTKLNPLKIKGADKYEGYGISYCSTCDGALFTKQEIAVYGGGIAALEEACALSMLVKKITIINPYSEFRTQPGVLDLAKSKSNIEFMYETDILKFNGEDRLTGLELKNTKTNKLTKLSVKGLFPYVGVNPNSGFLNPKWNLTNTDGYIKTNLFFETKQPRLFAVGDIAEINEQQYTVAMSSATIAMLEITRQIVRKK